MAMTQRILLDWAHFISVYATTPNSGSVNGIGIASSLTGWMPKATFLIPLLTLAGLVIVSFIWFKLYASSSLKRLSRNRRTGWIILTPMALWLLWTPYANTPDFLLLLPFVVFIVAETGFAMRRIEATFLVVIVLVVPALQQMIVHHLNQHFERRNRCRNGPLLGV
jgi:membrane-associated HD superfamily phosphohydrolase